MGVVFIMNFIKYIIQLLFLTHILACSPFNAIIKDATIWNSNICTQYTAQTGTQKFLSFGHEWAPNGLGGYLDLGVANILFAVNSSAITIPIGKTIISAQATFVLKTSYQTPTNFNVSTTVYGGYDWDESRVQWQIRPSITSTVATNIASLDTNNLIIELKDSIVNNYGNVLSYQLSPYDPVSHTVLANQFYSIQSSSGTPYICATFGTV